MDEGSAHSNRNPNSSIRSSLLDHTGNLLLTILWKETNSTKSETRTKDIHHHRCCGDENDSCCEHCCREGSDDDKCCTHRHGRNSTTIPVWGSSICAYVLGIATGFYVAQALGLFTMIVFVCTACRRVPQGLLVAAGVTGILTGLIQLTMG